MNGFAASPVISGIQDVVFDVVVDCGHAVVAVVVAIDDAPLHGCWKRKRATAWCSQTGWVAKVASLLTMSP